MQVYQVSDQCMALVRDGVITASSKDSKHMKVRKSTKRIIPDVMYATKDKYGNEVVEKAEPNLPLDFFIIKVTRVNFQLNCRYPMEHQKIQSHCLSPINSQWRTVACNNRSKL